MVQAFPLPHALILPVTIAELPVTEPTSLSVNNQPLHRYLQNLADLPEFVELGRIFPHTRGNFGNTPLHVAAIRGELDALGWLLDAGADIDAVGEHGYTALHEAIAQHQREAVRFLLARGASPEIPNADGDQPLALAERLDDQQTIAVLLGRAV